ncbi:MAG: response regulator [SAR202 cluster bacterium]|nr:response regulator [SAR202 cluster bacterium]MDP6716155.1 response regulator [SAR202 cluster bacterium]
MAERILIVDDERLVLDMLVGALNSGGYETCCASDGFEAVQLMTEASPDLIITDMQIPGLDGHMFIKYIRRVSDTPVMVMTGEPEEAAASGSVDAGADSFLAKPLDLPEVMDSVAKLLSGGTSGQAPDSSPQESKADLDEEPSARVIAEPIRIDTGYWEFDQAFHEGIPSQSVTLVEGAAGSGKSVLCQNLASAGYRKGLSVAYYTSLPSADDLSDRMSALGLDVAPGGSDQFKIISLDHLYSQSLDSSKIFTVLREHMKRLFREGTDMVIFDDITPAVSDDPGPVIRFLEQAVEISRQGLTILPVFRPSNSDRVLVDQLHEIADAHLRLSVEETPKGNRMEIFNQVEVRKIDGVTPIPAKGVAFRVNPRLIRRENRSLEVLPAMGLML